MDVVYFSRKIPETKKVMIMRQPPSPWDEIASDKEKIRYLEKRIQVVDDVDAIIEQCHVEKKDLGATLDIIFQCIQRHMAPAAIFLQTQNEELRPTIFSHGITEDMVALRAGNLLQISKPTCIKDPAIEWFAIPLDMAGETIGAFGIGFLPGEKKSTPLVFDMMNAIAEELDGFFYGIQASRIKHLTILEIQRCLKSKNLMTAIDMSINMVSDSVPVQELILMYLDEDLEGNKQIQYVVYRDFQKLFDSAESPMPALEAILKQGKEVVLPGNRDLEEILQLDGFSETILLDGLLNETLVGKLILRPAHGTGFSIASREIVQVFAEALRQRLVDFNREKNLLRQFFSPEITRKLLKNADYREKLLSSHQAELGVLFADVSGFTKLSEQVLKEPKRITDFINNWAHGVVEGLFKEGGVLDKLVGDCIIGLFGPPFYELPPPKIAVKALQTALFIRKFTGDFLRLPENEDVQRSPLFKEFGVAIGINFCPANVGMLGPNKDFTAFSSGMNNTARLQGLAKAGEILVTPSIKELAEQFEPALWSFEGPFSAGVKNVKDPLTYFRLKL
jgi:class 3 adenylate cyclase